MRGTYTNLVQNVVTIAYFRSNVNQLFHGVSNHGVLIVPARLAGEVAVFAANLCNGDGGEFNNVLRYLLRVGLCMCECVCVCVFVCVCMCVCVYVSMYVFVYVCV